MQLRHPVSSTLDGDHREFKTVVPLSLNFTLRDIKSLFRRDYSTALWLDEECYIVHNYHCSAIPPESLRYRMMWSYAWPVEGTKNDIYFCQVPGVTAVGTPLPALEHFIEQLTSDRDVHSLRIECVTRFSPTKTLDVSATCFSRIIQASEMLTGRVILLHMQMTASQTMTLFVRNSSSICIGFKFCHFHAPTLLAYKYDSSTTIQPNNEHAGTVQQRNNLYIGFGAEQMDRVTVPELTALLSNPNLASFCPYISNMDPKQVLPYEMMRKFVCALAAAKVSKIESLYLDFDMVKVEWTKEKEPSMWTALWKAIEEHPSLATIHLTAQSSLYRQSWLNPIKAAVNTNPRILEIDVDVYLRYVHDDDPNPSLDDDKCDFASKIHEHVEPLLYKNRYRPRIAALCRTGPSNAAILLGQAITAVARKQYGHEIIHMLMHQLVLTGYDIGGVTEDNLNDDVGHIHTSKRQKTTRP